MNGSHPTEARTRRYYDDFSRTYDEGRETGYHALVDRLEADIVLEYARGLRVLEVGCGTGLILARVAPHVQSATGLDLSPGMLARARERGFTRLVRGSATALPFADESFDVVYSFKVLAHVPAIDRALAELARVTRRGGYMLLEFYNRWSLRWIGRQVAGARRIGCAHTEADLFTRWDSPRAIRRLLPPSTELVDLRGVRVWTPAAFLFRAPIVAPWLARAEERAARSWLRIFGGFLVAVVRRKPTSRASAESCPR
jgi:ubiquinone/menaquinone biosynthesis C-methylase UbiE